MTQDERQRTRLIHEWVIAHPEEVEAKARELNARARSDRNVRLLMRILLAPLNAEHNLFTLRRVRHLRNKVERWIIEQLGDEQQDSMNRDYRLEAILARRRAVLAAITPVLNAKYPGRDIDLSTSGKRVWIGLGRDTEVTNEVRDIITRVINQV
jgi:hypothetical protein